MDADIRTLERSALASPNDREAGRALALALVREGKFKPGPKRGRERERVLSVERVSDFSVDERGEVEAEFVEVTVSYDKGGANHWSGSTDERGYWAHVSRERRMFRPDGSLKGYAFTLFSGGIRFLISGAARFTPKGLASATPDAGKLAECRTKVLAGSVVRS